MSDKCYKSTGTIRVRFEFKDGAPPPSRTSIYFTPNADSTVRFDGNQYALFVPIAKGSKCLERELLDDSGKGVEIKIKGDLSGLVPAAVQHTLVEVEVEEVEVKKNEDSRWVLHAITVPPLRKKK